MTLGPREVMRSEEVDGLTGPANPIPNESLDCGCGQLPCPKLTKYATRKFFVALLCWIGFIQASAQTYFTLTSSTIARRFQFQPNTMEWLTLGSEGLLPFLFALPVSYWGDRIHRAAWTGGLVLIQSAGYLILIIPHFTHPSTRVIEETTNVTHLSLYAEDNPELCTQSGLARISIIEEGACYVTLSIIILALIVNCMGNIAFFALGLSYLDDNTRKRHVALPIAIILGIRIFGLLFGYLLAWGCLRIDAENLTERVESYREQIGAWWLGWPILAFLLAIPGTPMSWLPRRLPSEVIEQAAASIVDGVGRVSPLTESSASEGPKKVGDSAYFSSLWRLLTNKILLCNIFASVFCVIALVNFANTEDVILESLFYVPRPAGLLLGFGDPLTSRIVTTFLRPVIIGTVIIVSGIIITQVRPRARWLIGYNIIVGVIAAAVVLSLAFLSCDKPSIVDSNRGSSLSLLRYCNRNCRCSRDANFHPVCDTSGSRVFYTPCHAGCTGLDDTGDVKKYTDCSCVKEVAGLTDTVVTEGPCGSITCQIGWIVFQISTIVTYSLVASGTVASLLIGLRSTYVQDKALAIGLWISLTTLFTYIPGQLLYWVIADGTCIYRGNSSSQCHLHDSDSLGAYLAYLTALLLVIAVLFEALTLLFCRKLKIYRDSEVDRYDSLQRPEQIIPLMSGPPSSQEQQPNPDENNVNGGNVVIESGHDDAGTNGLQNEPTSSVDNPQTSRDLSKANGPLKFGPLGPGNPRVTMDDLRQVRLKPLSDSDDTEDEHAAGDRRAPISLVTVQYKRLEMDSDAETTDSSPESRRRIAELQRSAFELARPSQDDRPGANTIAGFSKTDDIEFTKWEKKKKDRPYTGDFNEVGIPIVDYALSSVNSRSIGSILSPPDTLQKTVNFKSERVEPKLPYLVREVDRALSPVEHTSSGFGSCASDLQRMTTESSAPTPVLETSENEGSTKSSTASSSKRPKPSYSTAL